MPPTTTSPPPRIGRKEYGLMALIASVSFFMLMYAHAVFFNPLVHLLTCFALLALGIYFTTRRVSLAVFFVGAAFFAHTLFFSQGISLFGWNVDLICAIILILGGIFLQMLHEAEVKFHSQ